MNFQQLRIIRETARCGFNLTEVAERLFTSQSGVSKHIKDLEDELGVELFVRKGKRLLGMTEPGKEMLRLVERMLLDAQNIKTLAEHYSQQDSGQLTVATTHTQARYLLPAIVLQFRQLYPKVHLQLHQGSPREIAQMLLEGSADIGIATETLGETEGLLSVPYHGWHHHVVVPKGHALLDKLPLSLEQLSACPLITYHQGFTGRARIEEAFQKAGLRPDIVLAALDADVIKSYVELGLGVGIVAEMAFDPARDRGLAAIDASHLFPRNLSRIAIRQGHLLRKFAYHFIRLCAPQYSEELLQAP